MDRLSDKQIELAENNYGLLFSYAYRDIRGSIIPDRLLDDFLGELRYRLCISALRYDERWGFKFSTFCYHGFRVGTGSFWRKYYKDIDDVFIPYYPANVRKLVYNGSLVVDISSIIDCINDVQKISNRNKNILFSYFLDGNTMEQIGILYGLSKERVSQILEESLIKVKEYMQINQFEIIDFIT